jgi:hypothetical protein
VLHDQLDEIKQLLAQDARATGVPFDQSAIPTSGPAFAALVRAEQVGLKTLLTGCAARGLLKPLLVACHAMGNMAFCKSMACLHQGSLICTNEIDDTVLHYVT